MPQLHIYVPEGVANVVRRRAEQRGMSVSGYLAELVTGQVASDWPERYFDKVVGGWTGEPLRRPPQRAFESREEFKLARWCCGTPASRSRPQPQPLVSLPFDDRCAEEAAFIRLDLERSGRPIGPSDLLIAATARAHDLALVTHNTREFARVPGLRVVDWES